MSLKVLSHPGQVDKVQWGQQDFSAHNETCWLREHQLHIWKSDLLLQAVVKLIWPEYEKQHHLQHIRELHSWTPLIDSINTLLWWDHPTTDNRISKSTHCVSPTKYRLQCTSDECDIEEDKVECDMKGSKLNVSDCRMQLEPTSPSAELPPPPPSPHHTPPSPPALPPLPTASPSFFIFLISLSTLQPGWCSGSC